jgi:hypothetical protein
MDPVSTTTDIGAEVPTFIEIIPIFPALPGASTMRTGIVPGFTEVSNRFTKGAPPALGITIKVKVNPATRLFPINFIDRSCSS